MAPSWSPTPSKLTAGFGAMMAQPDARAGVADAARTARWRRWAARSSARWHSLDPYLMQLRLQQRADDA